MFMNRHVTTLDNGIIRKFHVSVYLQTLNKHIYIHPHSFYITPNHIRLKKIPRTAKKVVGVLKVEKFID